MIPDELCGCGHKWQKREWKNNKHKKKCLVWQIKGHE